MSYEQAVKHWKNHRKDRFHQPIYFGDGKTSAPTEKEKSDATPNPDNAHAD